MLTIHGKYTTVDIHAKTVEESVFSQVFEIANSRAFEGQRVACMPDVHAGESGPCGLVATIGDYVCPEHVGVDIGCTVSMLLLDRKVPKELYEELEHRIQKEIPFGKNIHQRTVIDEKDFYRFLTTNFNRYRQCWIEMLDELPDQVTEKWVSNQLNRLGMNEGVFYKSLGTVGGGNHFIEYDEQEDGEMSGITLHFGSRNFGIKVWKYWSHIANGGLTKKEKKEITHALKKRFREENGDKRALKDAIDDEIEKAKSKKIVGYLSDDGMKGYLCDMCFAQLYAAYNHLSVQRVITNILLKYGIKVDRTITSVHNFIDLEDHMLRKSAIRSYNGEEMLVPFNMRDGVAICEGLSNDGWLNSCSHGAGRRLSRSQARKEISLDSFKHSMEGIFSTTVCANTIDEAPMAYKDTNEILELIQETCIIKCVLKPKINIKGVEKIPQWSK